MPNPQRMPEGRASAEKLGVTSSTSVLSGSATDAVSLDSAAVPCAARGDGKPPATPTKIAPQAHMMREKARMDRVQILIAMGSFTRIMPVVGMPKAYSTRLGKKMDAYLSFKSTMPLWCA